MTGGGDTRKTNKRKRRNVHMSEEMIVQEETGEVLSLSVPEDLTAAFSAGGDVMFSTFVVDDSDECRMKVYKMKNNPSQRISDVIGSEINMAGFLVHWIEQRDAKGRPVMAPRIVLLDTDGETYVTVSVGVYNALKNIAQTLWMPTQEHPIKVTPVKRQGKHGYQFTTIEVVA
jgi:hypothetical protein